MSDVTIQTKWFVGSVALAALAVTLVLGRALPPMSPDDVEAAVFFALAALVASSLAYRLPRGGFGNIAFIPLLSGVAVAPSVGAVIGAGVAVLVGEYFLRREPIRVLFNASQLTIAVGLAVLVYRSSGGEALEYAGIGNLAPFVAAFATFFVSNAVMFAGVVSVSSRERFSEVLARAAGGAALVYDLIGIPLVFGFAYAYVRIGWVWSGALLIPLLAIRQMYKVNRELQTVNEDLLQLMVAAIEARDPYTSGHSQRVAEYSKIVARAAGLGPRATERVHTAALLHDVGKIHEEFAPILRKPGRLSDAEFAIMKSHSEKGAALVGRVTQFEDLVPAVRGHHEAWNGSGYPGQLAGEKIDLWARIIAFADTIDAMTTDRPYREALSTDSVRAEVIREAGRQFDPRIATALTSDSRWAEMANAIREYRHSHIPQTAERSVSRHSSADAGSEQALV
ncbi:MAG: HD-GYP domain-containing protein [Gemmatimonadota bacterium]|nr:HD-GYP domain-containing protein [Gemmatimonadota bacterium]